MSAYDFHAVLDDKIDKFPVLEYMLTNIQQYTVSSVLIVENVLLRTNFCPFSTVQFVEKTEPYTMIVLRRFKGTVSKDFSTVQYSSFGVKKKILIRALLIVHIEAVQRYSVRRFSLCILFHDLTRQNPLGLCQQSF